MVWFKALLVVAVVSVLGAAGSVGYSLVAQADNRADNARMRTSEATETLVRLTEAVEGLQDQLGAVESERDALLAQQAESVATLGVLDAQVDALERDLDRERQQREEVEAALATVTGEVPARQEVDPLPPPCVLPEDVSLENDIANLWSIYEGDGPYDQDITAALSVYRDAWIAFCDGDNVDPFARIESFIRDETQDDRDRASQQAVNQQTQCHMANSADVIRGDPPSRDCD